MHFIPMFACCCVRNLPMFYKINDKSKRTGFNHIDFQLIKEPNRVFSLNVSVENYFLQFIGTQMRRKVSIKLLLALDVRNK